MARAVVYVNECAVPHVPGETADQLRARYKADADVIIANGYPVRQPAGLVLQPGDRLVLIRRGETPDEDALRLMMVSRNTPGVRERLAGATVGIAGLGGLGSNLAAALVRIGVGRLILVDFDVVEPSNLNRQLYFADQLGLPKTEATLANLRRVCPWADMVAHNVRLTRDNVPAIFHDADVVAECFDAADQKRMLAETVLSTMPDTPLVAVSGIAGYGDANALRVRRRGQRLWVVGDESTAAGPGMGLMAPRVLQAVGMQANTIVRILMNETEDSTR